MSVSVSHCFLDQFPVEIFHILFDYIPTPELYLTFFDVSDYVNAVLHSYPITTIDLRSYLPYHLDSLCQHIQPTQVTSLTICDNNGQSQFFFSYFQLEHFTELQSLTLIDRKGNSSELFFSQLNQLPRLQSFSFYVSENCQIMKRDCRDQFHQIKSNLVNNCPNLVARLHQLTLLDIHEMTLTPFSRLSHLKLFECGTTELKRIASEAFQLKSLVCSVHGDLTHLAELSSLSRLTRLHLKIEASRYKCLSMDVIERFLPQLSRLKQLKIESEYEGRLDDGQRWAQLTKSLRTFDFKFRIINAFPNFQTSFWFEEKRWHVVYDQEYMYTVPYFAPKKASISNSKSTSSNYITDLMLSTEQLNGACRFPNVKVLKMYCVIPVDRLSHVIRFNQVKHMVCSSKASLLMIASLISHMNFLNELTIAGYLVRYFIRELQDRVIRQIQIVHLSFCYLENETITEILCHLLPSIKYLDVSLIETMEEIGCFIRSLPDVANASFAMNSLRKEDAEKHAQQLHSFVGDKFSFQISYPSDQDLLSYVHVWLSNHVSARF